MDSIIYSEKLRSEGVPHFVSIKDFSLEKGTEWRVEVAQSIGYSPLMAVAPEQTHSDRVVRVTKEHAGQGYLDKDTRLNDCDALVCDDKEICIHVLTADCVPVLLYDKKTKAVAAIHAGWKGTAKEITAKTVMKMQSDYGTAVENIIAYIGPSIGKCCFEVGDDVAEQIGIQYAYHSAGSAKPRVDLKEANRMQLVRMGLREDNIEVSNLCTVCDNLPSWRRERTLERIGTGIVSPGGDKINRVLPNIIQNKTYTKYD